MLKNIKKSSVFILLLSLFFSTASNAIGPIKQKTTYAKQLADLKKLYELGLQQLEEFKEQTKILTQVREFYKEVQAQKELLKDWELLQEKFFNDVEELSDFSNMGGFDLDTEEKIDTLMKALEKRLAGSLNNENKEDRATLATKMVILKAAKTAQNIKDEDPQDVVTYHKIQEIVEEDEKKRKVIRELTNEIDYVFRGRHASY